MTTHHCPALLIAAPASGQGKTTVTAALARLHSRLGRRVRVFKCGPDFLDPMILARASGQPVYQLDLWMIGEAESRRLLAEAAASADLILIEGVMGLFDGQPSAADLARRFGVPVLGVIDASAMAQTFAALAHGLATFQPDLPFAGVLANRVGSSRHGEILRDALPAHLRWFGALPRNAEVELPSRHLGLVQAEELADLDARLDAAADALAASADTELPATVAFVRETVASTLSPSAFVGAAHGRDSGTAEQLAAKGRSYEEHASQTPPDCEHTALVGAGLARDPETPEPLAAKGRSYGDRTGQTPADCEHTAAVRAGLARDPGTPLAGTRIAVARDAAFAFLYQANLDLLESLGAELQFFSPLTDRELPPADSLYLPGGYPELHLETLSQNHPMQEAIRAHHAAGQPILAECGGMLYLLEALTDKAGQRAELVGLLPGEARMQPKLAALALQEVVLPEGTLRGHTYHHSTLTTALAPLARGECPNYRRTAEAVYRVGRLTASYIHLYLPSNRQAAAALFRP